MEAELEPPTCRVAAVVPAAGCGQRMGNPTPKQYLQVCGRPLITHCLKALEEVSWIERTILVADDLSKMAKVVQQERLTRVVTIEGTGSRHRSIRAGVEELAKDPPDIVVIHDGVRPLMPIDILIKVVKAAHEHGASGAVRSLVSTVVKFNEHNMLQESLIRDQFLNSEMPQAFKYSIISQAYKRCSEYELNFGTECLALALNHCGVQAKLVPGSPQLWKVTDEKDLAVAKILLPKYTRQIQVVCHELAPSTSAPLEFQNQRKEMSSDALESVSVDCVPKDDTSVNSVHKIDQQTFFCDSECSTVFEALKDSLKSNSKSLVVSNDLNPSQVSACSVIVISRFQDITAFKSSLSSLCHQLVKGVTKVLLVFTINYNNHDLSLSDTSALQQILKDVTRPDTTYVTLLLLKMCGKIGVGAQMGVKLVDMVNAILDQQTGCFDNQILLIE